MGQTASNYSEARITNHLKTKHKDTGVKLEIVKSAVQSGKYILLVFIDGRPSELRHILEEKLISEYKPEWNQHKKRLYNYTLNSDGYHRAVLNIFPITIFWSFPINHSGLAAAG